MVECNFSSQNKACLYCTAIKLVRLVLQGSVDTLVRWGGQLSCLAISNYVRNYGVKNYYKMLSYRRETALQGALQFSPKVEDWNWETIFYGHY